MNILAIDASSKFLSLAVARKGSVERYRNLCFGKKLSDSIIPAIQQILRKSNLSINKLDGFALGLGPGSFTSLRVGFSTVKGLAFATGKPVVGVSSLDVIAQGAMNSQEVVVICDAKRNLVYSARYAFKENMSLVGSRPRAWQAVVPKGKTALSPMEEVLEQIEGDCCFVGDGIPVYQEQIKEFAKKKNISFRLADQKQWYPQARHLLALSLERFREKKFDDINRLTPLYLYPQDCQVRP